MNAQDLESHLPEGYVRPKKKNSRGKRITEIKGWERVAWDRWKPAYISLLLRLSIPQIYVYRKRYAPHLSMGYWQRIFTKHPCLLVLDNKTLGEKLKLSAPALTKLRKRFNVTNQVKLKRGRNTGDSKYHKMARENPELLKLEPATLAQQWGCTKRTIYNVRKRYLSAEQDGDGGVAVHVESTPTDGGGSGEGGLVMPHTGPA